MPRQTDNRRLACLRVWETLDGSLTRQTRLEVVAERIGISLREAYLALRPIWRKRRGGSQARKSVKRHTAAEYLAIYQKLAALPHAERLGRIRVMLRVSRQTARMGLYRAGVRVGKLRKAKGMQN